MTTDADMKRTNEQYLKHLQAELAGLDGRRRALEVAIEAVKALIGLDDDQHVLFDEHTIRASSNGHKANAIPAGFFTGKTPTQAYRDLMRLWPGEYSAPEIADAFQAGGLRAKSRTALIQAIHTVIKRDRRRAADAPAEALNGA